MRILLIEDDKLIGDGIKVGLSKFGFSVDWFTEGLLGFNALQAAQYDAVVLDLTLPGLDGMDILQKWRQQQSTIPVLILTARTTLDNKIDGLSQGADDYMVKPFALQELAARLRALIRRSHNMPFSVITHGSVSFNPLTFTITQNNENINLSPKEVQLVELLLHNQGRVLTKAAIEEKLYPWGEEIASNAVEVHVHHLRRKLGKKFIQTVHRVGYKLGGA